MVTKSQSMNALLIRAHGNNKSVPPLRPAHSQFIADTIRLLLGVFPRTERPSYLKAQHAIGLFFCSRPIITHITAHSWPSSKNSSATMAVRTHKRSIHCAFRFLHIFAIVQTIPDSLSNRFAIRLHSAVIKLW